MEVHHHSHHGKKKWTEYFWEFLMLFLAVFCGFLAEYQLEHVIEHSKEKEYMRSMVEDLQQDTTVISEVILKHKASVKNLDTLLNLLELPGIKSNSNLKRIYDIHFGDAGADLATFSQRTMSQLKNAGGLRLIRIKDVADGISLYDSKTQELMAIFKSFDEISTETFKSGTLIFDTRYLRHNSTAEGMTLLTDDKHVLRQYANYVFMFQAVSGYYYDHLSQQKGLAVELINLIKKEYHFK